MKFTKMQGVEYYDMSTAFTEKAFTAGEASHKTSRYHLTKLFKYRTAGVREYWDRKSYETYGTGIFVWRK